MIYAKSFLAIIGATLQSMNACYGRGRITQYGLGLDGEGFFDYVVPTTMHTATKPIRRRFRVLHRYGSRTVTVYALKHQRTSYL